MDSGVHPGDRRIHRLAGYRNHLADREEEGIVVRRHTDCAGGCRSSEDHRNSLGHHRGTGLGRRIQLCQLASASSLELPAMLTLCSVTTRPLLSSVGSMLRLRLSTVSCLRSVLALALAMLLSTTELT